MVRFYSPVRYVENRDDSEIFSITTSDRIFARKAQMNYSWDFCGRCVTVGIWKNVSLTAVDSVRISSHYLYTKLLEEDSALLHLNIDFSTPDYDTFSSYYVSVNIEKDGNPVCHISERPRTAASWNFPWRILFSGGRVPTGNHFSMTSFSVWKRKGRSFRKYAKNSEYAGLLFYRNLWRTAFPFNSR